MKKNNPYLTDDEIDLRDLIKSLWREKILILSISIIFGLAGYLYATFQPQEFKTEFEVKYLPYQLSKYYKVAREEEIITSFNLNFLSLSNMEGFLRESREFDNFKEYLKIRNINPKKYFNAKKFGPVKEEKQVAQNKYFIVHPKELDQIVFINNYIEFINNKIISEFKDTTKQKIISDIILYEESLEVAKQSNLEKPILQIPGKANQIGYLYHNGIIILTKQVNMSKEKLATLEREQFKNVFTLNNANISVPIIILKSSSLYSFSGMIFGFLLSLIIIFFKNLMKK
jgi:LPS O-antigen subunit length determinant protein (WzzB/FepE family)